MTEIEGKVHKGGTHAQHWLPYTGMADPTQVWWQEDGYDFEMALLKISTYADSERAIRVLEEIRDNWHTWPDSRKNARYDTRAKLIGYITQVLTLSQEYLQYLEEKECC